MSLLGKLFVAVGLSVIDASAVGIIVADPTFGLASDPVFGDPLKYAIQNASISGPSVGPGPFVVTINTNYGVPLPGSPDVIPSFLEGSITLWMGDFLIQQGNNFYGIVLSPHDGYAAGDVYQAPGFQNSVFFNKGLPVSLAPGGVQIGTGTVSAAVNVGCNGVNCAEFRVIDSFTIDPQFNFVDWGAPVTIRMASATCANGYLLFDDSGDTPEPATKGLIVLAIGAMSIWRFRKTSRLG
jgi:hypothetical protein